MDWRHRVGAKGTVLVVAALAVVAVVAVVAKHNAGTENIPMTEERIATELIGNPAAARCTMEHLEEAGISPEVLKALVDDPTGGMDIDGLGSQDLDVLDEAQSVMWACMASPTSGGDGIGAAPADVVSSAAGAEGSGETVPDPRVVLVDGQPPIYNATPVWAPEPGTVTVLDDGSAVVAERPVTIIVPFENMPERATNRD